jgi:hypothetical protein
MLFCTKLFVIEAERKVQQLITGIATFPQEKLFPCILSIRRIILASPNTGPIKKFADKNNYA